jgi:predicted RNase H-like nuclease (RuvC/YqgF family)
LTDPDPDRLAAQLAYAQALACHRCEQLLARETERRQELDQEVTELRDVLATLHSQLDAVSREARALQTQRLSLARELTQVEQERDVLRAEFGQFARMTRAICCESCGQGVRVQEAVRGRCPACVAKLLEAVEAKLGRLLDWDVVRGYDGWYIRAFCSSRVPFATREDATAYLFEWLE